ncbi:MAG: SUMF1/EgtB/PvdO family nonheme iron enzyme [Minwuia sp.]|uniref:SUMF1/EgtB/PvdO family nonheme iron enzyme n=1 Tax=Minwuia sp. TaxID=2493630 RepID=UPI003A8A2158
MRYATCSALAAVLLTAAVPALAEWKPESSNPAPMDGDLTLPMPCGGAMTFRKIRVPGDGMLEDQRIPLGTLEPDRGYAEFRHNAWLSGAFSEQGGEPARHYFLGKYEVSAMQYAAIDGDCPDAADTELEKPATRLTWAEAALFAERYSDWLLKNAPKKLPAEEGAPGFLRLPTEAEWEYAARGGSRVSPAEFADRLPFPAAELDERVIHDGNSYRELNLIGTLKPNPLGLHDMLGNAAEMTIDPFRLNAVTRLHGRAGGFALRGGSFRTRATDIRTSHREEFPPIDAQGIRRPETAGFRLVLVAPALPTRESIEEAQRDWQKLPQEDPSAPATALAEEKADPVQEARALAEAAPSEEMKRRLQNLSAVIAESIRTRNEQRDRAARELLSNAIFAARRVATDIAIVERWSRLVESTSNAERRERYEKNRNEDQQVLEFNLQYYLDRLTTIAGDYGDGPLKSQAGALKVQYDERGLEHLRALTDSVVDHVGLVRKSGTSARGDIFSSLQELSERNLQ